MFAMLMASMFLLPLFMQELLRLHRDAVGPRAHAARRW